MKDPLHLLRTHDSAVAYLDQRGELTYAELADCVATRALALRECGVGPGTRIAFCPSADRATLIDFWALWTCHATACPISSQFPAARQRDWVAMLRAAGLDGDLPLPTAMTAPGTILLSSGSTGTPKAVVHRLSAHVASAESAAERMPLTRGDRWLWSLPAFHVSGLAILIRCALAGATVVSGPRDAQLREATLVGLAVTHLSVVPTQLRRLLQESWFPHTTLSAVLLGGAAIPHELLQAALDRHTPVQTTYGMTETASQIATSRRHPSQLPSGVEVLPGWEVRTDAEGEILVRGPGLCEGYDCDGQVIPAVDDEGWYHTGDRGRLQQNQLQVSGRIDQMIISGGENIYPEAIERTLLSFPEVTQVVVVGRADDEFGQRPVAFIQASKWRPDHWQSQLAQQLRKWEVPQEYFPLPPQAYDGLKPNRAFLAEQADTLTKTKRGN